MMDTFEDHDTHGKGANKARVEEYFNYVIWEAERSDTTRRQKDKNVKANQGLPPSPKSRPI